MKTKNKIDRREFLEAARCGCGRHGGCVGDRMRFEKNDDRCAERGARCRGNDLSHESHVGRPGFAARIRHDAFADGCCAREGGKGDEVIDQPMVNELVDYALAHGVNYFDTSPAYCRGLSERATGTALKRHPRDKYFIATKLSNFSPDTWGRAASMRMYRRSFEELQVDYIDYLLLHGIGMGGMDAFRGRYVDNGMPDFLVEERKAGRIRNLGSLTTVTSKCSTTCCRRHDEYKWDFVQIQLNYLD